MSLGPLLDSHGVRIAEVTRWLDALHPRLRLEALRALDRHGQRRLYTLAAMAPALTLDDLVPADRPDRAEVRHLGRNTLPVPAAFRVFEKRVCRPLDGSRRLFGYNEGASRRWLGPGYFVARPVTESPVWAARGDIVVDYFQVPDGPVAETWPAVVPNTEGPQRFVFHRTRDFLRRVSEGVCVGVAYRNDRSLDHYFVLARDDA